MTFLLPLVLLAVPVDPAAATAPAPRDPLPGIVFVSGPIVEQGAYHWRDSYIYPRSATIDARERTLGPTRPGKNLYALVPARPDGKLTRLTHLTEGEVFDPEPSFDGRRVLFAMRRDHDEWFHLFEVNVDGSGLRQ